MSYVTLNSRLNALNDAIKQTTLQIQRLSKLQPHSAVSGDSSPAPGSSTPRDISPEDVRADLSGEIHESLKQQEEELELLKQDVEDVVMPGGYRRKSGSSRRESERESECAKLNAGCARLDEDLRIAHNRFRKAQLQAKHNFDIAAQNERVAYLASLQAAATSQAESIPSAPQLNEAAIRASLFGNRRSHRTKNPNAMQSDMLLTATSDITASLRRTHNLLTSELSRSRFAHETLDASNAALSELTERYSSLEDLLKKSRSLLDTLWRSNKSDTWYLETAMYMLLATCAWLFFRRILYGPLWWFVWWPISLFWRWSFAVLGAVAGFVSGGKQSSTALASSMTLFVDVPSGMDRPPSFEVNAPQYVPVGAGGGGVEELQMGHRSPQGSLSDIVGRMVEASSVMEQAHFTMIQQSLVQGSVEPLATQPSENQQQEPTSEVSQELENKSHESERTEGHDNQQQQDQPVRRADGEILRKRDEAMEPVNPKKRMWEEPQQREL